MTEDGGQAPLARSEQVVEVRVGDEALLVDLRSARQHRLNPSALAIWQAVDGTRTPADVVAALAEAHGLAAAEIDAGVRAALDDLLREGAAVRVGEAVGPPPSGCSGCGDREPPPPPPDPLGGRDRSAPWPHVLGPYRAGGVVVEVHFDDPAVADRLAHALADLAVDPDLDPGAVADQRVVRYVAGTVVDDPGRRHVEVDGEVLITGPPGSAEVMVLVDLTRRVVATATGIPLHAGAVADGDRAVVLPGRSGAGKSTLVAGLVARGRTYLGDEVTAVDPDGLRVHGFPKALFVDAGAVDALEALGVGPLPRRAPDDLGRHHLRATELGAAAAPTEAGDGHRLAVIALPERRPSTTPRVERLEPLEATEALVRNAFRQRLDVDAVHGLAALATTVPCYRLVYEDLADGCALVEQLLDELRP